MALGVSGAAAAHAVRVEPEGIEFDVAPGESLMQAAQRRGYYWPTVCGGDATCGACRCEIKAGAEAALPAQESELLLLRRLGAPTASGRHRLACRLHLAGPATVIKRGVRRR